jgi:hypothetical protein
MLKTIAHDTVNDVAILVYSKEGSALEYYVRWGLDSFKVSGVPSALARFMHCQRNAILAKENNA